MAEEPVLIVPYRDGPYLIRGPVSLRDQTGAEIEAGRRVVALCRCGKSRLRPFCDGSHHLIHFSAPSARENRTASAAPREAPAPVPRETASPGTAAADSRELIGPGSRETVAPASGGTIAPASGGTIAPASGGTIAPASGGTIAPQTDLGTLAGELLRFRDRLVSSPATASDPGTNPRVADAARLLAAASAALRDADAARVADGGS